MKEGAYIKRGWLSQLLDQPNKYYLEGRSEKFAVVPAEIDMEKFVKSITPQTPRKKETIKRFLKHLSDHYPNDTAKQNAIAMWWVNIGVEEIEKQMDDTFAIDFYHWLQGKMSPTDAQRTPWYQQGYVIKDPEVLDYISIFLEAKIDFHQKLFKLSKAFELGGLNGINEYYLFFKYIVRRSDEDLDQVAFLKDYELFWKNYPNQSGENKGKLDKEVNEEKQVPPPQQQRKADDFKEIKNEDVKQDIIKKEVKEEVKEEIIDPIIKKQEQYEQNIADIHEPENVVPPKEEPIVNQPANAADLQQQINQFADNAVKEEAVKDLNEQIGQFAVKAEPVEGMVEDVKEEIKEEPVSIMVLLDQVAKEKEAEQMAIMTDAETDDKKKVELLIQQKDQAIRDKQKLYKNFADNLRKRTSVNVPHSTGVITATTPKAAKRLSVKGNVKETKKEAIKSEKYEMLEDVKKEQKEVSIMVLLNQMAQEKEVEDRAALGEQLKVLINSDEVHLNNEEKQKYTEMANKATEFEQEELEYYAKQNEIEEKTEALKKKTQASQLKRLTAAEEQKNREEKEKYIRMHLENQKHEQAELAAQLEHQQKEEKLKQIVAKERQKYLKKRLKQEQYKLSQTQQQHLQK